jgi:hypothetical protein
MIQVLGCIALVFGGFCGVSNALRKLKGDPKPPTAPSPPQTPAERKAATRWQLEE